MKATKSILSAAAGLAMLGAGTANAATEISFWHAMGGQLGETVNAIAKDFNASQSEYKLTPIYKGGYEETMTAGIAAFRAKEAPHIIQIFDAGAATIINAKGAVYPVASLLNDNGVPFNAQDYIEGVRNFYADSNGDMIGMPFNSSTPVLYYNKEALAKAGVQPPKTWEEFQEIAPKLKKAGYISLSQSHSPWIFSENFHSRHNIPLSDANNGFDGVATKINYNNEHMRMHFKAVRAWQEAGHYGYYGTKWGDNQKPFIDGEVAMWLGSSGSFGGLTKSAKFEFGTTNLPYWNSITKGEEYATFIGGAALFSFNGHEKAEYEGVAKFFEFLTKPETQLFWHKETGYVAITNDAYKLAKDTGYYKEKPDAEVGLQQLNQKGAAHNKGYRLGYYVQIREVMYREYDQIFGGTKSVDDAFAAIEEGSNKLLARFAKTVK